MGTVVEWEKDLLLILSRIEEEFPEFSQNIATNHGKDSNEVAGSTNTRSLEEYYNYLLERLRDSAKVHRDGEKEKSRISGYPLYLPAEDIYQQGKREIELDPSDLSKRKTPNEENGVLNERDFGDDKSGSDLDVPGSELDDQQESVGSEDEENNYYSLGGDLHNDLEENNS